MYVYSTVGMLLQENELHLRYLQPQLLGDKWECLVSRGPTYVRVYMFRYRMSSTCLFPYPCPLPCLAGRSLTFKGRELKLRFENGVGLVRRRRLRDGTQPAPAASRERQQVIRS